MPITRRAWLTVVGMLISTLFTIPHAQGATVTSTNSDAEGLCTQSVDVAGNIEVRRFGADCVITFKAVGATVWTIPAGVTQIRTLIVAGGGGGGFDVAGGGGAGGLLYYGDETPKTPNGGALTLTPGTISVSVGAGGAGATSLTYPSGSQTTGQGANGGNSSITLPSGNSYIATRGGGGNSRNKTSAAAGGGSGGGGGYGNGTPTSGGAGTSGQGFAGGMITYGNKGGAGGGGAGGVGRNWDDTDSIAGQGGVGLQYSISGTATYYAGGGGGGSWDTKGGPGGLGGGGAGGSINAVTCRANCTTDAAARTGVSGTANTGGGGGGSGNADGASPAGAGGSGVVIIRYTMNLTSTASLTLAVGNLNYKTAKNISVTTSSAGRVDFKANGKFIPGCRNKASNAGNSYTVTCSYLPARHGIVNLTAVFIPSGAGYQNSVSNSVSALVLPRVGNR